MNSGRIRKKRLRRQVQMKGTVEDIIQHKYETRTVPITQKLSSLITNLPSLGFGNSSIKHSTVYVDRDTGITVSNEEVERLRETLASIMQAKTRGELSTYLVDPNPMIRGFAQEVFSALKEDSALAK